MLVHQKLASMAKIIEETIIPSAIIVTPRKPQEIPAINLETEQEIAKITITMAMEVIAPSAARIKVTTRTR